VKKTPQEIHQEKLAAAKEKMGTKHVLHPGYEGKVDLYYTDVRRTFDRLRRQRKAASPKLEVVKCQKQQS
jgi:hypothetical protein